MTLVVRDDMAPPPLGGGGFRGVDIVDPFLKDDDLNDDDVFDTAPPPLPLPLPPRPLIPTFRTRACRAAVEAAVVVEDDAEAAAEAAVLDDVAAAFAAPRAIAADSGDDDGDEDVVSSSSGDDEAFASTGILSLSSLVYPTQFCFRCGLVTTMTNDGLTPGLVVES